MTVAWGHGKRIALPDLAMADLGCRRQAERFDSIRLNTTDNYFTVP